MLSNSWCAASLCRSLTHEGKVKTAVASMDQALLIGRVGRSWRSSNTALELRRRRSPNGEREAAASTTPLPARPPRGAVSFKRSFGGACRGFKPGYSRWQSRTTKPTTATTAHAADPSTTPSR